jgi:hypothetical protein
MATAEVLFAPGTPTIEPTFNSGSVNAAKSAAENLKRSYEQYAASERAHEGSVDKKNVLFSPEKHLNFQPPSHVHSMEDIGLPLDNGVSPVAVSEPFQLFSEEAIDLMRQEVLDPEVMEKYSYTSDIAPKQIRGYAPT